MRPSRTVFVYCLALLLIAATHLVVLAADDPLPSWNDGPVKKTIAEFVGRVTTEGGPDFVPPVERIATFDSRFTSNYSLRSTA